MSATPAPPAAEFVDDPKGAAYVSLQDKDELKSMLELAALSLALLLPEPAELVPVTLTVLDGSRKRDELTTA